MSVYIQSARQISAQQPLSDEWFEHPITYTEKYVSTLDPPFSEYLSPLMSRRMCTLLKRAVVVSRLALKDAGVEKPDAIISGTGLGCIANTEQFLLSIMENNEQFLQPTFFMQSTHNILSATVAIDLKCHGYNNTYVHRGVSFDHALLDAFLQFGRGKIETALVGGYDELTEHYYSFFDRLGTWDFEPGRCFAGEAAVSMLLGTEKQAHTLCRIDGAELMYRPTTARLRETLDTLLEKAGCEPTDIDAVLTGINTHNQNDAVYHDVSASLFGNLPILHYKHLFGESFSSSALGVYVAATCLRRGHVPAHLLCTGKEAPSDVRRILVYNHYKNKSHSFILLSSC
ncbi:beta-ketoacyl synthase N-terminal-like domain-containing protein [Tannerella sp.]|uniref:beta-ketoacyl synthase N-terminal-like domain-containing protein n=1 Tax=Tannerella sp. TaxID=2382127 RepID=UPI0026DC5410|nr:beta-ketoacyl synthase N-terminal-like domain-containing protein [Tannerella sp.]MDO4703393.1 beta-ketoacyl synthase N-terminal-like domain-containing protein [Tannerella sp.]